MSHDSKPGDEVPHAPRWPTTAIHEGFGSFEEGRDIFYAAVETTRMPMVVADPRQPDVPIVFVNKAFLEMTGYSRDEVVGRNCRFLQGPDTDRNAVAQIREAVRTRSEITIELLNYRKDGRSFWNALFLTPVRNKDGEVVYLFSSQLDISRRHDAETAIRQAQKMEALGQLTGGIAHDFNNLLQIIVGNVELARLLTRETPSEKLTRALDNVKEAARKSGALTQQLLAFARKQQLQGRVINLNDLLRELLATAKQTVGPGIALEHDAASDLWNTRVDPGQLNAAVHGLLTNAREAMLDGGTNVGKVVLRTANVEADAHMASQRNLPRAGRFVELTITDTGAGIAPDILPRVMDPFFSTKPQTEGKGLGLSMVYGFAKQSGGVATIQSELNQGTTVRLYFPATEDSVVPGRATRPPPAPQRSRERILIVDDRPEIAEMVGMILGAEGYECVECVSAEHALRTLAESEPFQLLLTDLIMPGGMNGVLLAKEAQRRDPAMRVLLMTGFADGALDRWDGQHDDVIFKPFAADELQLKVRRALDAVVDGASNRA